ncbi:hypothetical protein [Streptomyces sp. NPDC001880]
MQLVVAGYTITYAVLLITGVRLAARARGLDPPGLLLLAAAAVTLLTVPLVLGQELGWRPGPGSAWPPPQGSSPVSPDTSHGWPRAVVRP